MSAPLLPPDLLAAALTARDDPATEAFDRVLAAAEASGALDSPTARELRFWQRRSLESLTDHACVIVPALLDARLHSDRDARESAAEAGISWSQALALQPVEAADTASGAAPQRLHAPGLSVVSDDD